jgi:hypothetical protein
MHGPKNSVEKVYKTYRPYPVSWGSDDVAYSQESPGNPESGSPPKKTARPLEDFHELIGDVPDDWFTTKPITSNDTKDFKPLRLLQSLFSDRLCFLQSALDELEKAKSEREKLIRYALDELDPEIRECEVSLSALKAAMNNTESRRNLERRLFELKRERRREALLNWRDLVWLRGEIRKLRREIDTIGRTTGSAQNRQHPA